MQGLAQQSKDMVPLRSRSMEGRESLIACVTEFLREESDDEVVESIAGIAQDTKQNVGVKEGLKSLYKNVWPSIRIKTQKPETADVEVEEASSSVVVVGHEKGKPRLESRLDHEVHPMHNELILKKIFDSSSVNDLKNFRLVSTKWRDLSLTAWRGKAVLDVDKIGRSDLEKLVKEGSQFRETPFKSYRIYYSHYDYVGTKKNIWPMFGSNMQHLDIRPDETKTILSALSHLSDLRTITFRIVLLPPRNPHADKESGLQNLPSIAPNLSKISKIELKILITDNMDLEPEIDINLLWKTMYKNVPALKILRVQYLKSCRCFDPIPIVQLMWRTLRKILEAVREIRKEGSFEILNLEELDIVETQHQSHTFPFTEEIMTIIAESRLPLQRLGIHLGIDPNPSAISNFLEAHAETLQYLKCESDPTITLLEKNLLKRQSRPYLPLKVVLPNLKELVVLNGSSVWAFYVLGSLDAPNLETLRIEPKQYYCDTLMGVDHALDLDANISMFELYPKTCLRPPFLPNVKKFFYRGSRNFSASELHSLAKAMPSVIDLTISLRDNTFPTVYDLWPRLETLHILSSDKSYQKLDDYDVTGFPFRRGNDVIGDGVLGEENRVSNITNLKDLRKFVFETGLDETFEWPRRPLITDLSAVYGFLQLPKLRILKLETFCSFSSEVKHALENHVMEINLVEPDDLKDAMDADASADSEQHWDTDTSRSENEEENESNSSEGSL